MDKPFDSQQIEKRLEWLDNEHRNDKSLIASMQKQLEAVSSENTTLRKQLSEIQSDVTRLNTLMLRLEQFEKDIANLEAESNRQLDGFKDDVQNIQSQTHSNQREIETLNSSFLSHRNKFADYDDVKSNLEDQKEEDIRSIQFI